MGVILRTGILGHNCGWLLLEATLTNQKNGWLENPRSLNGGINRKITDMWSILPMINCDFYGTIHTIKKGWLVSTYNWFCGPQLWLMHHCWQWIWLLEVKFSSLLEVTVSLFRWFVIWYSVMVIASGKRWHHEPERCSMLSMRKSNGSLAMFNLYSMVNYQRVDVGEFGL